MAQYIDKAVVVAEIDSMLKSVEYTSHCDEISFNSGRWKALTSIKDFLDTLEVKEVDLEKEIELIKGDYEQVDVAWNNDFDFIANHFFELGLRVSGLNTATDRGMAEEIIVNLKRVENDYRIDLTKEIGWLRNISACK